MADSGLARRGTESRMEALMRLAAGRGESGSMVAGCLLLALQPALAQKPPAKLRQLAPAPLAPPGRQRPAPWSRAAGPTWPSSSGSRFCSPTPTTLKPSPASPATTNSSAPTRLANSARSAAPGQSHTTPTSPKSKPSPALASQSDQLRQAGELARQGKAKMPCASTAQLYGDHPPTATSPSPTTKLSTAPPTAKRHAIAAMRALADRNPGDPRFAVELGTMLTYDPKTRAEGIRILHEHRQGLRPPRPRCARPSSGTPPIPPRLPSCANTSRSTRRTREIPGQLKEERVQARADELRHRPHPRRARRLCRPQRAPPRRSQNPASQTILDRSQPTAASPPAWASCACSRRTSPRPSASSPRPKPTDTRHDRRGRSRHLALLVHHGRGLRRPSTGISSTWPAPSTAPRSP